MASEDRTPEPSVIQGLIDRAPLFSFFQAVTLVERMHPDAAPVGHGGPAHREKLRFRPDLSMGFPSSDLVRAERIPGERPEEDRYRFDVAFLGLYGPSSPLPSYFTEDLLWDEAYGSRVRDFLDIFHHRLLSLFYRAWKKYRYPVQYRRGGRDSLSRRLLWLAGRSAADAGAEPGAEEGLPPIRLLRYAGLWIQRPRSAAALEAILRDFFDGCPVRIHSCLPRRATIAGTQRLSLGEANCRLGHDAVLGATVEDRSGKFRISIGPLDYEDFRSFLPGAERSTALHRIVEVFLTEPLEYDVALRLRTGGVSGLRLGGGEDFGLGWNTWLSTPTEESVELVF